MALVGGLESRWRIDGRRPALWYRGHADLRWQLTPGLLRHDLVDPAAQEASAYYYFVVRAPQQLDWVPEDDNAWSWLVHMQHYGFPTRLLDWSTRPLVALFFALYESLDDNDAVVWILAPEIWNQTEGRVEFFLAGFGTTGTLTGTGRYLKERNRDVTVIAIEPQKGHRLPGLKSFQEAKEPGILDWAVVDDVIRVDDEPAYAMTKRLYREEGLMVGPSTGAIVHAASLLDVDGGVVLHELVLAVVQPLQNGGDM